MDAEEMRFTLKFKEEFNSIREDVYENRYRLSLG